jgi:hypothetical protein
VIPAAVAHIMLGARNVMAVAERLTAELVTLWSEEEDSA